MAGVGLTLGVVMGALFFVGAFMFGIAVTVVISIIASFTTNHAMQGWGEEYRCNAIMLKSLYTNTSYTYINGSIADNTQLSSFFTTVYENTGEQNVAGCLIQNMYGWGPFNDSSNSKRRRRSLIYGLSGLYSIGQARIFYSTSCTKRGDKGQYSNSTSLSYCVQRRLGVANGLFNSSTSANFVQWTPVPTALTYSIVTNGTSNPSYQVLSIAQIYGVRPTTAANLANSSSLSVSASTVSQLLAGCQYIGPLSQSDIANILAAQGKETTTQPSSTQINSG